MANLFERAFNYGTTAERAAYVPAQVATQWWDTDVSTLYLWTGGAWAASVGPGVIGFVATDPIWDAKGDLAVGTGANTAVAMTVGTNEQFIIANSATATGLQWIDQTWDDVTKVTLIDSGGAAVARYAATTAGLTAAYLAATSGDAVILPPNISIAGSFSPPAGVVTGAISPATVMTGTLPEDSVLWDMTYNTNDICLYATTGTGTSTRKYKPPSLIWTGSVWNVYGSMTVYTQSGYLKVYDNEYTSGPHIAISNNIVDFVGFGGNNLLAQFDPPGGNSWYLGYYAASSDFRLKYNALDLITVTSGGAVTAVSYASTVATGTQPYICASTTKNANLNADLWDNLHAPVDANGYLKNDGLGTLSWSATAIGTPGTLTVSTANVAADPHTHAITTSSNPGASASILASDASGYLQLVRLGIGTSPASYAFTIRTEASNASGLVLLESGASVGGMSYNAILGYAGIALGARTDGVNWKAMNTEAVVFYKYPAPAAGSFVVHCNSGLIVGASFTPSAKMAIGVNGNLSVGRDYLEGDVRLHGVKDTATNNAAVEILRLDARVTSTGVGAAGFGPAMDFYGESATDTNYRQMARIASIYTTATDATRNERVQIDTYPAGTTVGHSAMWSGTAIDGTAQTIIANGTGDVTEGIAIQYVASEITGTDTFGGVVYLEPSDTYDICSDGTNILTITCAADGSVTIARSAGTDTFKFTAWMVWQ